MGLTMADFTATEERIAITCDRYPEFPRRSATRIRLIKRIDKVVHDAANAALKPYGINHPEYNLLMMMYGAASGMVSPSELADAAGEKSANITRLTDHLCNKGLIARALSKDDRRKLELSLTRAGRNLIESFLPSICKLLDWQGRNLSETEQKQLEKLLKKMLEGLAD
jgi:MarR family transcriptional repressor of emrRAB